jgi:hypothetical protein
MPPQAPCSFNSDDRAREKQAARDADDAALASGKISREELGRKNAFARADRIEIDFSRAVPFR